MSRYAELEALQAAARRTLPGVVREVYVPLRVRVEAVTTLALSDASDNAFLDALRTLYDDCRTLVTATDTTPLETALENAMAPALINGVLSRANQPSADIGGRLPFPFTAADGKRCGDSWIPSWKECHKKSRRKKRRKPTRKEKTAKQGSPSTAHIAAVERYIKGVSLQSPTGRTVMFAKRAAQHIDDSTDTYRHRFTDIAEETALHPTEIWREGMRLRYIKTPARDGGRSSMLVVTKQTTETEEEVVTFTKLNHNALTKSRRGRKIYPVL